MYLHGCGWVAVGVIEYLHTYIPMCTVCIVCVGLCDDIILTHIPVCIGVEVCISCMHYSIS